MHQLVLLRDRLQLHQRLAQVLHEGIRQIALSTVRRITRQHPQFQFDEAHARKAERMGGLGHHIGIVSSRIKHAHHQAVDWRKVLIHVQFLLDLRQRLPTAQAQRFAHCRGQVHLAQGADGKMFRHPIHRNVDRIFG